MSTLAAGVAGLARDKHVSANCRRVVRVGEVLESSVGVDVACNESFQGLHQLGPNVCLSPLLGDRGVPVGV